MSLQKDNAMDAINRANLMPVLEFAQRFTTLKKIGREWYGPCPVCRAGRDRFYVMTRDNLCGCRRCEKRWDTTGLYSAVYGMKNFDAALEILGEVKPKGERKVQLESVQRVQVENDTYKTPDWQKKAASIVEECGGNHDPKFSEYVKSRGLNDSTLSAFRVGYQPAKFDPKYGKNRPAMVIPWIGDDQYYSVKYRFINVRENGLRYISLADGNPLVFGEHLLTRNDALIVVEGEINGMSIWQECHEFADVLSIGGDSNDTGKQFVKSLAENRGYDLIVAWFDELAKAEKFKTEFEDFKVRPVHSISGMDANDVLTKQGGKFLASILNDAIANPDACPYCNGTGEQIVGKGMIRNCFCKDRKKR